MFDFKEAIQRIKDSGCCQVGKIQGVKSSSLSMDNLRTNK